MNFKLSTATLDGIGGWLVSVEGELDISTAEHLAPPCGVAVSTGCPLVLDLSRCTFIDSGGLRFVLRTHTALAETGKPMAVVTDQTQVRKLLSTTAIDMSVPVFAELDEAVAWLGAEGANRAAAPDWPLPAAPAGGLSRSSPGR